MQPKPQPTISDWTRLDAELHVQLIQTEQRSLYQRLQTVHECHLLFFQDRRQLRRRSPPSDARDTILSPSVAERVAFHCDAHRRKPNYRRPRLFFVFY